MASLAICIEEVPQKLAGLTRDDDDISSGEASTCDLLSLPASPSTPDDLPSPQCASDSSSEPAVRPTLAQVMSAVRFGHLGEQGWEKTPALQTGQQPSRSAQVGNEHEAPQTFTQTMRAVRFPHRLDPAPEMQRLVKPRACCQEPMASQSSAPTRVPFAQKLCDVRGIGLVEDLKLGTAAPRFEQPEASVVCGTVGSGSRSSLASRSCNQAKESKDVVKSTFAEKLRAVCFQDWECSVSDEPRCAEPKPSEVSSARAEVPPRAPFAQKLEVAGVRDESPTSSCSPSLSSSGTKATGSMGASCSKFPGRLAACKGFSELDFSSLLL